MSRIDNHALLSAVAAELADMRAGIEAAGELVGEMLRRLPPGERLGFLTRSQAFDVLAQRADALAGLARAIAENQPIDTALAALPLAEMAERLQEAAHRTSPRDAAPPAAGDLVLFD